MAAASFTLESAGSVGNDILAYGSLTGANPYATGGDSVAGVSGAGQKVERVGFFSGHGSGYLVSLDKANQKVIWYRQKDPGNAGGADIPLVEVANGADLSGVTVTFFLVGQ